MTLAERIAAFEKLGLKIDDFSTNDLDMICSKAEIENSWFTSENVRSSLHGIRKYLDKSALHKWLAPYNISEDQNRAAGIVMAGNIPLVGFHDLLSVLVSGFGAQLKPSSDDTFLIKYIIDLLLEVEPRFAKKITYPESLKDADFYIATGSDNTARYFEYYFRNKPSLIRKNRTSVAIISGNETDEELKLLGNDIFQYFGLGCRNVSKIFHPSDYDIRAIFPALSDFEHIIHHNKYRNNYDYNKSILLVNKEAHLDTGFLLTKEDTNLVSPISVLFTEGYSSSDDLANKLSENINKIQCVVASEQLSRPIANGVYFGNAQVPNLWDYADGVDTIQFLTEQY